MAGPRMAVNVLLHYFHVSLRHLADNRTHEQTESTTFHLHATVFVGHLPRPSGKRKSADAATGRAILLMDPICS